FFRAAGDVDLDRHRHLWMQSDLDLVHTNSLDRTIKHDLTLGYVGSDAFERFGDVARRHRPIELAGVRGLTDQLDRLPIDALRRFFGVGALLRIVFFDPGTVRF